MVNLQVKRIELSEKGRERIVWAKSKAVQVQGKVASQANKTGFITVSLPPCVRVRGEMREREG